MTNNIECRLLEHQFPEYTNAYTALRLPVTLVYLDGYGNVHQAIDREKQFKKWSRKKGSFNRKEYRQAAGVVKGIQGFTHNTSGASVCHAFLMWIVISVAALW